MALTLKYNLTDRISVTWEGINIDKDKYLFNDVPGDTEITISEDGKILDIIKLEDLYNV